MQQLQIQGTEIEQDEPALIKAWESLPVRKRLTLTRSLNTEAVRTCLGVMAKIKNRKRRTG